MSSEYKFACPQCDQPFNARYEHIGMMMTCPACENEFRVPNFLKAAVLGKQEDKPKEISAEEIAATKRLNSPVFNSFTPEQLERLTEEDEEALAPLRKVRHRNRWELGIMAALLTRRVLPLKQAIFDTPHEQVLQSGWLNSKPRYHQFLRAFCLDHFAIVNGLQQTLAGPFITALKSEDLDSLLAVANQLYQHFTQLIEAYERCFQEPIPNDDDYLELHAHMAEWYAECCKSLLLLVEKLSAGYSAMRDAPYIPPQISLSPLNLHFFMSLSHKLGVGFEKPKP